ncbi:MAG TPA: TonB-dependent receptor [Steroidobacteraceae bacterium]|jgi:iron complex outermembrane receptor protein|nr:TonB-dependent receptor [Steroidobacteraceae bacterium]
MVISRARIARALLAGAPALLATPAFAADPDQGGGLEEVVVSAQFREEKLQSTPIAISAFTAENLEVRGIDTVTDLDAFVPNAVIQPLGAGWGATMAAFIRGVGLGDNILSFEPGVPIYVDDVYIGRPQGAIFDLLDLERVEVLRGPQGTLFGKNAIGGTIRLISKKPQGDGSGSLSVALGSFNRLNARGSMDVSLIEDKVFARFSFSSKKADGYFNVLDYECVNGPGSLGAGGTGLPAGGYNTPGEFPGGLPGIRLGSQVAPGGNCVIDTLGDENVQSGRAAFRFLISDALEFNLIGDLTVQRQKGPADKYTVMDQTNGLNAFWNGAFAAPVFGNGIAWDDRFITPDLYSNYSRYNDPITNRIVPNINDMDHWGVSGTFEWKLTDTLRLKSITAYRRFWNKFGRDSDGTPLPLNATYDDSRHRQFTQELQLTGTVAKLNWATGAFYYDAHDSNQGFDFLYPTIVYENDAFDRQDTKNWAVFAQGTYQLTDAFSFTAGARYTHDDKDATIYRANFFGGVVIDNAFVPLTATKTDVTLSADYQWNDDLMTYVKYATGFKGGGFSPRPATALQTEPFKPEKLKTLELGAKSELLERRVRLNGAVFFSRYLNQQTFAQQLDASGANWFREVNAGKARIWGLEGELQAEPVSGLRVEGSFGYINYNLYDNEGNVLLFEGDNCGGRRCYSPRTPKWNGAVGVQYSFGTGMGSITPRLDAQYQSTIYFTTNNQGVQPGYTLLNGRLTWQSESTAWEVALYGDNLTDKGYFNGKLNLVGFFGREQGNPGAPRTWGLSFKRNFNSTP